LVYDDLLNNILLARVITVYSVAAIEKWNFSFTRRYVDVSRGCSRAESNEGEAAGCVGQQDSSWWYECITAGEIKW